MKLLAVAYKFAPINQPGARRRRQIIQHFANNYPVHVLTPDNRDIYPVDEDLTIHGLEPHLIQDRDLVRRRLQQESTPNGDRILPAVLRKMYHSFPFVLWGGDGGGTYMRNSFEAASQLITEKEVTHIFSSYRPWSDHIIASRLKKKHPNLCWIADFRDRPVDPIRKDVWWPALQSWWQKRLLRNADVVTTVSEGLAEHFREDHPKVVIVRNGMPRQASNFLTAPVTSHFRITYTGKLYPKLQSAELLFKVLRQLINDGLINPAHLELHYAGKDSATWASWVKKYTLGYLSVDHGFVSVKQAETLQQESQLNLLLSWSASDYGGIMTAKLGSYLAAGRPVLGLLNGPMDQELQTAIEETGAGRLFSNQTDAVEEALSTFLVDLYRTWAFSGAVPWRLNAQKMEAYSWPYQIEQLEQSLKQ